MESRREFIKKATLLSTGAGLMGMIPESIKKAMAINPNPGTTFLDAEHIVVLMQENRSFDHSFGSLRGVRGFNDPRAMPLPDKLPVWLQTNADGQTYAPFRLNIKDTKSTWMSALPHSWTDQVDALNKGRNNRWLDVKQSGNKEYKKLPLTMGYYNRADIPFYYAMADAFTVCDYAFCSSLTGTTPNRLYLWTGTIRDRKHIDAKANVLNSDVTYSQEANWTTFPERLEDNNISWGIYQNEISLPMGWEGEEEAWLANFTNLPIEWFSQYHVRFSTGFQAYVKKALHEYPTRVEALKKEIEKSAGEAKLELEKELSNISARLRVAESVSKEWTKEKWDHLSQKQKNLHNKAFITNTGDPDYHKTTRFKYNDNGTEREMELPKGDILHQFRSDVRNEKLPAISYVVAPCNFSDHPGAPWYGAWYLSEVMDILTENPEVWKKTIFIVCYDENDGYFDHIPPFSAPYPKGPENGTTTEGIDTSLEYVPLDQGLARTSKNAKENARENSIGLGFRVPLLIASPWSRGGYVNSEVFDHTSVLQLMEKFLSHKTGKKIEESNITDWRRTVCGDLTSAFRPYNGEKIKLPEFEEKETFMESIHKAKFKELPTGYHLFSAEEKEKLRTKPHDSEFLPKQEKGTRPACALPYELYADGQSVSPDQFQVIFKASDQLLGNKATGAPFKAYTPFKFRNERGVWENGKSWDFAVAKGKELKHVWNAENFEEGKLALFISGPNGFHREFYAQRGTIVPTVSLSAEIKKNEATGQVIVTVNNTTGKSVTLDVKDESYQSGFSKRVTVAPGKTSALSWHTGKSYGWYDLSVTDNSGFRQRFAGHLENGKESMSDPLLS